ncbi:hypothetical protein [Haloparvum sedimenti]|uniref:hypothetical protein n=1 Tax=Haloparvum sedimenti TaxID=1678448 RepID=UPI00071E9474|nr:hypothetical protein [Haloparvum sedimenti]
MREDEMATALVDHYEALPEPAEVRLEEPYDAEGAHGVADAHVRARTPERVDYLVELKADAAVRHATGANEVLRQYRRMERYFYRDDDHAIRPTLGRTSPAVHLLLLFAPTPACVHHVAEHASLYASVERRGRVADVPAARKVAFLTGIDGPPEELGFLTVNGGVAFGTDAFREAVPEGSRLAETLARMASFEE